MTTWIVVAHQGGARLIGEQDDKLCVLETIEHPEARDPEAVPRPPDSYGRKAPAPRDSQRGHAAGVFAAELAERLRKARNERSYRELFLIAAPRFLGALRTALDPTTASTVRGTLDKDFAQLDDRELLQRLERL